MITTNINNGIRNFYVWAERPEGPWSDPVWLDWPSMDPSLFFDDDGRTYITGPGGFRGDEPKGIYQAEIEIETGRILSERRLIWGGTGGKSAEGPHLYRNHGKYYLLAAEGGTEYGHMVTIARSKTPYGPFESNPGNPILTHRSTGSAIQATGHADFLQIEDGSWWAVFLGIRPVSVIFGGRHHHLGRETFLAPVTWSSEGWPVIGDSGKVSERMDAGTLPLETGTIWVDKDDFETKQLLPDWNFLRNPIDGDWSLEERPGWLTLRGSEITLNDIGSPAFVGRRQQHFRCAVSTLLSFKPVQEGEEAGLTVYMNERFHYEIALTYSKEGQRIVILRRRIGSLWKVELEARYESSDIILGVDADPTHFTFYYSELNGDRMSFGKGETSLLSTEVAGGFTGVYFGLYATGNGRRCTAPAMFEWFQYIPLDNKE